MHYTLCIHFILSTFPCCIHSHAAYIPTLCPPPPPPPPQEWRPDAQRFESNPVALMQIATPGACLLIRTHRLRESEVLPPALEDFFRYVSYVVCVCVLLYCSVLECATVLYCVLFCFCTPALHCTAVQTITPPPHTHHILPTTILNPLHISHTHNHIHIYPPPHL